MALRPQGFHRVPSYSRIFETVVINNKEKYVFGGGRGCILEVSKGGAGG